AVYAGAIAGVLGSDTTVHKNAFGGEEIHDVVARCRTFARRRTLLADRARHQVRGHRHAGAVARTAWFSGRVVGITSLTAPLPEFEVGIRHYSLRFLRTVS